MEKKVSIPTTTKIPWVEYNAMQAEDLDDE